MHRDDEYHDSAEKGPRSPYPIKENHLTCIVEAKHNWRLVLHCYYSDPKSDSEGDIRSLLPDYRLRPHNSHHNTVTVTVQNAN